MKPSFTQINQKDAPSSASFAERGASRSRPTGAVLFPRMYSRTQAAPRSANEALLGPHEVYFQSRTITITRTKADRYSEGMDVLR